MSKEKLESYRTNVQIVGGISFFGIPLGLIVWIFFSYGWKIALISLIVFITMLIVDFAIDIELENITCEEQLK